MPKRRDRQPAGSGQPQLRQRIAVEAARIISEQGVRDYHQAKMKAAQRFGATDQRCLPDNQDIDTALREHQRLFHSDAQPRELRVRRAAAVDALRFFAGFEPRLVGAVLDGSADQHSAICLHLYSDDEFGLLEFLTRHDIPYSQQSRRLRFAEDGGSEYPVYQFIAGEIPIDLTLLPYSALRQSPLDRINQRPMPRAALTAVLALLHDSSED